MSAVADSLWHWMERGSRKGPITWQQLQALASSGKLKADDMVMREGSQQWQPARTAREFDQAAGNSQPNSTAMPPPMLTGRPTVIRVESDENCTDDLTGRGLQPLRALFGLVLIVGGIFGTTVSHSAAVERGGGTYIMFTGPIIWGCVLFLSSFNRKMKRTDE